VFGKGKIKIINPWKKQPLDWSNISSKEINELWNIFINESLIVNGQVTQSIPLSNGNREIIEKVIEMNVNKTVSIVAETSIKPVFSRKKIDTFFGVGKSKDGWDWERFINTSGFSVSENLLDWVVGQDRVMGEVRLCLDEWLYKLKHLQKKKWYKPWLRADEEKPHLSKTIPPGPYLLLLGDPGTGKSLIGRAMAEYMTSLYYKHDIKRFDVVCHANKTVPSNPKITIHPAGKGRELVIKTKKKVARKGFLKKWGMRILQWTLGSIGAILLGITCYVIFKPWILNEEVWRVFPAYKILGPSQLIYEGNLLEYLKDRLIELFPLILGGGSLLFYGIFIGFFGRMFGRGDSGKGIGGAEATEAPKLLVDNSVKTAPFIDATGHTSAQLFGSIAWDPYQTGGLGTPSHQRVVAGDVHRASMGIFYIDEIKNLNREEAITLLTVLEDGQLPITMRGRLHGADTAAMAVGTEPIPALFFLLAAGNFDSINKIHPALMDRMVGYGRVVRMNNDMKNNIKNRRKYVQFIAQESQRFHLPTFSREACIEIVNEGRQRSNKRDALVTKFRPLISIIKTAGTLARNENLSVVKVTHVKKAINEHCKTIQKQLLEHAIQEKGKLLEINPEGSKLGTIYGLAVVTDKFSGEMTGSVLRVKSQMIRKDKKKEDLQGYYNVTGIAKDAKWMKASAEKVRSVILQKYGVDIAQEYFTHIDFSQAYGVDGPSAGVTMTLLLCSLLEGKPIRQDVAVTGEINISAEDEIEITAVGGLHEKIKAAEMWGFKKVVIPKKNFNYSIKESDYDIEVVGAANLAEYLKEVLVKDDDTRKG